MPALIIEAGMPPGYRTIHFRIEIRGEQVEHFRYASRMHLHFFASNLQPFGCGATVGAATPRFVIR